MASLKELKNRIRTVRSTRKITAAMRLVASAKLHKAQRQAANARLYRDALLEIAQSLPQEVTAVPSEPMAVIVLGAGRGMCGAYDSNLIREAVRKQREWAETGIIPAVWYVSGHKVAEALRRFGLPVEATLPEPDALDAYRRVVVLSTRSESLARQQVAATELLVVPPAPEPEHWYVYEPYIAEIRRRIRPELIAAELEMLRADAAVAEQAARMIAMQGATDNADELLHDLALRCNTLRQQLITGELQDIAGNATDKN